MAGSDRAINMALRVLGIGEVERDFKRVGGAGSQAFAEVKRSANGAAQEVSSYTARLRGAVAEAKRLAAQIPQLNKPTATSRGARNDFIKGAVSGEQDRILKGLPDVTSSLGAAEGATAGLGGALGRLAGPLAIAYVGFRTLKAVLGPLADAEIEHEKALSAFNATIALAGNKTRVASADIQAMAESISTSTNQSAAAALAAAQQLTQVGGLSATAFELALESSARYADAVGKELPDVIQNVTMPVLQALANNDMKALYKAVAGLDEPLGTLILNLAEAGRTADAQRALFNGLAEAAGDGPGGLAGATAHLNRSWENLKATMADNGPFRAAGGAIDWLAGKLDSLGDYIKRTQINWRAMLAITEGGGGNHGWFIRTEPKEGATSGMPKGGNGGGRARRGTVEHNATEAYDASLTAPKHDMGYFKSRYGGGGGGGSRRRPGGGGGGESAAAKAKQTALALEREAKQAEDAAQRLEDSNQKVVDSWAQRVADIEAKVGLEGDALKLVERNQARDAAMRQINLDLVDKEVEAERKRAAVSGTKFDEVAARTRATEAIKTQQAEVGDLADRYVDAEEKLALFNKRQAESKSIMEGLKSPIDKVNDEIETAIELLKAGLITVDQFDARMKQLSYSMADARHELDQGAKAWEGFGQDVGRTLADVVLNGGNAIDILQQLIRMPLERILQQKLVNPVADYIDGLTGNNREKNAGEIYGGMRKGAGYLGYKASLENPLDPAAAAAAASTSHLASSAELAAAAVARFAASLNAGGAGAAGGGGSGLGGLLGLFSSVLGPSSAEVARLTPDVLSTIAANPGVFAAGTPGVPVGQPFWVGDNGRELMQYHAGGRLEVINGPRTHRALEGGGGVTIVQHVNVPERADPRRTAAGIARSTQGALMRSARKGLAGTRN